MNTTKLQGFECFWCKSIHLNKAGEDKYICKSCGNVNYKLDNSDNVKFIMASTRLANYEYESAYKLYQELSESPNEKTKVQAIYGKLLSFFGVTYIKDFNGSLVVTFSNYKPQYSSITECSYYKDIINSEYKDEYISKLNELDTEYKRIKLELNKGIKYDVFICTKISLKTKDNPNIDGYTVDSDCATDIYNSLIKQGLKVFYSKKTLSGIDYDAQIYSALMRSEKILVISSKREYLESSWVQSEWERWINFIKEEVKGKDSLYLFVPNNVPIELPLKLEKTQKFTSELDLVNRLSVNNKEKKTKSSITELLNEARYNLNMFDLEEAEKIYKQITHDYPHDYRGWLGLVDILIEKEVSENDKRYQRWLDFAIEFADDVNKQIIRKKYCKEEYKNEIDLDKEFEDAEDKYEKELYDEAFKIFEKLATEYNYEKAYNKMGECLYYGEGVPQDYKKAFYWYEKAANSGDSDAQFGLGLMYHYGEGIPQDFEKAFYWYEKAANLGDADAQNNLGYMYFYGVGVPQDYEKALYWYEKSANAGHDLAQYTLGLMYEEGLGVVQDYKKALYWYEKSANAGHDWAQKNLGDMYYNGKGAPQDYKKALYWYEKSANAGNTYSQYQLGQMCYNGDGTPQDYKKAFYWYEKAANAGDAKAQYNLSQMYKYGYGVKKNKEKAKFWEIKSKENK